MKTLRLESPWTSLWMRIVCGICGAAAGVYCYSERTFPPVLAVGLYWGAAVFVNRHRVVAGEWGVEVRQWPLPLGFGVRAGREEIAHAYVRPVMEEWAMGVETVAGQQIDLHFPFADREGAMVAAKDIATILAPIKIRTVETKPLSGGARRALLLWAAVALAALAAEGWGWRR